MPTEKSNELLTVERIQTLTELFAMDSVPKDIYTANALINLGIDTMIQLGLRPGQVASVLAQGAHNLLTGKYVEVK